MLAQYYQRVIEGPTELVSAWLRRTATTAGLVLEAAMALFWQ